MFLLAQLTITMLTWTQVTTWISGNSKCTSISSLETVVIWSDLSLITATSVGRQFSFSCMFSCSCISRLQKMQKKLQKIFTSRIIIKQSKKFGFITFFLASTPMQLCFHTNLKKKIKAAVSVPPVCLDKKGMPCILNVGCLHLFIQAWLVDFTTSECSYHDGIWSSSEKKKVTKKTAYQWKRYSTLLKTMQTRCTKLMRFFSCNENANLWYIVEASLKSLWNIQTTNEGVFVNTSGWKDDKLSKPLLCMLLGMQTFWPHEQETVFTSVTC